MTPEEINRTIEFILQHQAQTSLQLGELASNQARPEDLFAQIAAQERRLNELLDIQSRRLDRAEKADEAARKQHEELMTELRDRLDRIFDSLPKSRGEL